MNIEWYNGIPASPVRATALGCTSVLRFPKSCTAPSSSTKQQLRSCLEVLGTDPQTQCGIRSICVPSAYYGQFLIHGRDSTGSAWWLLKVLSLNWGHLSDPLTDSSLQCFDEIDWLASWKASLNFWFDPCTWGFKGISGKISPCLRISLFFLFVFFFRWRDKFINFTKNQASAEHSKILLMAPEVALM